MKRQLFCANQPWMTAELSLRKKLQRYLDINLDKQAYAKAKKKQDKPYMYK